MTAEQTEISNIEKALKELDVTLFSTVTQVKEKAEELLSTIPTIFPEYTSHTIRHKEQVLRNFDHFIPGSLLKDKDALNKYELFFLISATYLHDIGLGQLQILNDTSGKSGHHLSDYIRDNHQKRADRFIQTDYLK